MQPKLAIALLVVVVIVLGAWNGLGQSHRSGRASFEYMVIDDPTWTTNVDGAMKKLNQLGTQGWEITGVSPSPNNPTKLFLKRQKR